MKSVGMILLLVSWTPLFFTLTPAKEDSVKDIIVSNWCPETRDCFPSIWDELSFQPPFPTVTINPWLVRDRFQAYKWIVDATMPEKDKDKPIEPHNINWGSPIQLNWQLRSGRLYQSSEGEISPYSWFGSGNYFLCILPLIGAFEAGLFGNGTLKLVPAMWVPPNGDRTVFCIDRKCNNHKDLESIILGYAKYFRSYREDIVPDKEELQRRWWSIHGKAVEAILFHFSHLRPYSPSLLEWEFVNGWAYFTKYLGIFNVPTDLNTTILLQQAFPQRVLGNSLWELFSREPPMQIQLLPQKVGMITLALKLYHLNPKAGPGIQLVLRKTFSSSKYCRTLFLTVAEDYVLVGIDKNSNRMGPLNDLISTIGRMIKRCVLVKH